MVYLNTKTVSVKEKVEKQENRRRPKTTLPLGLAQQADPASPTPTPGDRPVAPTSRYRGEPPPPPEEAWAGG